MNFGVSGSIGACSSHIYSNPVTIAAVKRQQEKERDRAVQQMNKQVDTIAQLRAKRKEQAEWNWRFNFLQMIYAARAFHLHNCAPKFDEPEPVIIESPIQRLQRITSLYKTVEVRGVSGVGVRITAEQIIAAGAVRSGFTVEEIKGQSRVRPLVAVRQYLMVKVSDECPWLSLPVIGRIFGGRDHTTVLHAINKLGGRRASNRHILPAAQLAA